MEVLLSPSHLTFPPASAILVRWQTEQGKESDKMNGKMALAVALALFVVGSAMGAETAKKDLVKAGDFVKIYDPSVGEDSKWYINDHCFIRGNDGLWHLFGITHREPADPMNERHFAHATAKTLLQKQWDKQPFALSVAAKPWREIHLWAPHVVEHDGLYYMFYCAGDEDHTKYKLHLATSKDLRKWNRVKENPMVVDGFDARDPFVTKVGDKWVMYYTATSKPSENSNHIVVRLTSEDLVHWSNRKVVFTDPSKGKWGGPTESPFVVRRGDSWYLFIGPRNGAYNSTDVFRSNDPFQWRIEDRVGHIASHAAEVVRDLDGKWYVSRCGWGEGGVYLAPLIWSDGLDKEPTNIPVPKAKKP
jgi:arabinan endo-1,5-alpha-L-arabinosidase